MAYKDRIIREREAEKEMLRIGADPAGIGVMRGKAVFRILRLVKIRAPLANIIKENMLSAGGDAAVHKLSCACGVKYTDVLLMGTISQYRHLLSNMPRQPYGGKDIHKRIKLLL